MPGQKRNGKAGHRAIAGTGFLLFITDLSEPIPPPVNTNPPLSTPCPQPSYFRRKAALARRISRSSSRLRISCRLSYSTLPLQTASNNFTRSPFQ